MGLVAMQGGGARRGSRAWIRRAQVTWAFRSTPAMRWGSPDSEAYFLGVQTPVLGRQESDRRRAVSEEGAVRVGWSGAGGQVPADTC